MVKVLDLLNQNTLVATPSNVAADTFATTIETKYPELGAIRCHAWDRERRAVRDHGRPEREARPEIDISAATLT